ncbi:MAG TPA: type II toxin-antitoxin system PemK/MazF family toxin [Pseudoneobacillus sp.]|nr:type II toxin-antitoxin system PemK/MazF family toxin [Pseudoneobacillus sp.]
MSDNFTLMENLKELKKIDDSKSKKIEKIKLIDILQLNDSIDKSLSKTKEIITKQSLLSSSFFLRSSETWNQYGIYGNKKNDKINHWAGKSYSRGKLLFIDYGQYNIGEEFSLEHMGIVIQDFGNDLITVLPVTTDRGQTYHKNIERSIIRVKSKDYSQFEHNSILLIHQIITVSKNRIIKELVKAKTLKGTPLFEEIQERIVSSFAYDTHKGIIELNSKLGEKELEIEKLKSIIQKLEKKENVE